MPPQSEARPAETRGRLGSGAPREYRDPIAQHIALTTITRAPTRSTDPSPNGSKRNARPAKPTAMPRYAPTRDAFRTRRGRRAPSRSGSSRRVAPRHPPARSAGTTPASRARHEQQPAEDERGADLPPADRIRSRSPRGSANARSTPPAMRWRTDIARNGGRSRMTIASAMNVDPHTRYTVTRASHTRTP